MTELYHSGTLGPIPLSFTGRHLMQTLREAVMEVMQEEEYDANDKALSKARGRIAQYISKLERNQPGGLQNYSVDQLLAELSHRYHNKSGNTDED